MLNINRKKFVKWFSLVELLIVISIIWIVFAWFKYIQPNILWNSQAMETMYSYKENIFNPTFYKVDTGVPQKLVIEIIPKKKMATYVIYKKEDWTDEKKLWKEEKLLINWFSVDWNSFTENSHALIINVDFSSNLNDLNNKIIYNINWIDYNCPLCAVTFDNLIVDFIGNNNKKIMIKKDFSIFQL